MSRAAMAVLRPVCRLSGRGWFGLASSGVAPRGAGGPSSVTGRAYPRTYATTSPTASLPSRTSTSPPPPPGSSGPSLPLSIVVGALSGLGAILAYRYLDPSPSPSSASPTTLLDSDSAIAHQETHQPQYGTKADYLACIAHLQQRWAARGKADRVSTDEDDLRTHGYSEWSYHGAGIPSVVVWAETTEEVQEVVLAAKRWRVPLTPYSGGTSLEGHFSSVSRAVSHMERRLIGTAVWRDIARYV